MRQMMSFWELSALKYHKWWTSNEFYNHLSNSNNLLIKDIWINNNTLSKPNLYHQYLNQKKKKLHHLHTRQKWNQPMYYSSYHSPSVIHTSIGNWNSLMKRLHSSILVNLATSNSHQIIYLMKMYSLIHIQEYFKCCRFNRKNVRTC